MGDDAKTDFTEEELTTLFARRHGMEAAQIGAEPTDNPYEAGTLAHNRWNVGWHEIMSDAALASPTKE